MYQPLELKTPDDRPDGWTICRQEGGVTVSCVRAFYTSQTGEDGRACAQRHADQQNQLAEIDAAVIAGTMTEAAAIAAQAAILR